MSSLKASEPGLLLIKQARNEKGCCTASVYRCAVAENWWLSHLECRGYEQQKCEDALQVLRDRYLVEDRGINHEQELLVKQHNLIRSVAIAHRLKLLPKN